jgi:hypothetical protein
LSVPKITSITYPGDDTAANPTGGQEIILTGSGFSTGAIVNVGGVPASVSSVVNNNTISFTSPAKATGTYSLSVINADGGIATSISNLEYSGVPAWSTAAGTLGTLYETSFINSQLTAASDSTVTYAVTAGVVPAGTTLNSTTGILIGTAASVASSTTYSFTVDAVDAEQQNTSRNFSATINPDVVSWSSPSDGVVYSLFAGDVVNQTLSATSAAGKSISYSANALPFGLSISGSTLSGTLSVTESVTSLLTATAAVTGKTATRTINWNVTPLTVPIEYLVVGGGGGGGNHSGAGGGGVVTTSSPYSVSFGVTFPITIGAVGASQQTGGASNAFGVNAQGGAASSGQFGNTGGCGSGGGRNGSGTNAGGASTQTTSFPSSNGVGYGTSGGSGNVGTTSGAGGGGGAGQAGANRSTGNGGKGGDGYLSSITGSAIYYAAGGGGSGTTTAGASGQGSYGNGGRLSGVGTSGIVIVRYPNTYSAASATTGSPTITTAGGYRIYQFTSSGSITF